MTGIERIAIERERQINEEGWTPDHDDEHDASELAMVAAVYASPIKLYRMSAELYGYQFRDPWPASWAHSWDKRGLHTRLRQLEIAGALIAAEIDRLDRANAKGLQ